MEILLREINGLSKKEDPRKGLSETGPPVLSVRIGHPQAQNPPHRGLSEMGPPTTAPQDVYRGGEVVGWVGGKGGRETPARAPPAQKHPRRGFTDSETGPPTTAQKHPRRGVSETGPPTTAPQDGYGGGKVEGGCWGKGGGGTSARAPPAQKHPRRSLSETGPPTTAQKHSSQGLSETSPPTTAPQDGYGGGEVKGGGTWGEGGNHARAPPAQKHHRRDLSETGPPTTAQKHPRRDFSETGPPTTAPQDGYGGGEVEGRGSMGGRGTPARAPLVQDKRRTSPAVPALDQPRDQSRSAAGPEHDQHGTSPAAPLDQLGLSPPHASSGTPRSGQVGEANRATHRPSSTPVGAAASPAGEGEGEEGE